MSKETGGSSRLEDAASNMVQFAGRVGLQRVARLKDPSMQALLRRLKPGDVLEMTYSVAVTKRI